jgi:iron complex transport system ATP-binding protein
VSFCDAKEVVLGKGPWRLTPDPLSFQLPAGKVTALVGRNGSGKTTLLRALLGDPVVVSGEMRLAGLDARRASYTDRARLTAFVPQEHEFPGDASVETLLKMAYLPRMGLWGKLPSEAPSEIDAAIESFGLSGKKSRRLRELSTGERQRAFLARAVLQRPKVLILDEPTNHLDPAALREFWKTLLEESRTRGLELLVSTHDLEFLRRHCDYVLALDGGRKAFEGPRAEFESRSIEHTLFG